MLVVTVVVVVLLVTESRFDLKFELISSEQWVSVDTELSAGLCERKGEAEGERVGEGKS